MNCQICGAELKKRGEICNNCMNKLLKEQEIRNDNIDYYTFRQKFALGYELLKKSETIGIVLLLTILVATVDMSYFKYVLIFVLLFIIYGIIYLIYRKIHINSGICTIYRTKLVYNIGKFRKKVIVIPLSDIEDFSYKQGQMQQLFNLGTMVIKKRNKRFFELDTTIECVKNIDEVMENLRGLFQE